MAQLSLLVEKHIQKKNENLTILPVGFGDTNSQSVETKILPLTTSWSVNLKKEKKRKMKSVWLYLLNV